MTQECFNILHLTVLALLVWVERGISASQENLHAFCVCVCPAMYCKGMSQSPLNDSLKASCCQFSSAHVRFRSLTHKCAHIQAQTYLCYSPSGGIGTPSPANMHSTLIIQNRSKFTAFSTFFRGFTASMHTCTHAYIFLSLHFRL